MRKTVTIRGVPEPTLRALRAAAAANRRSLNGELLVALDRVVSASPPAVQEAATRPYAAKPARRSRSALLETVDQRALARVCRRHHIRRLALFGSQVKGDADADSDVDVLVEFEPGMTPGLGIETVAEALRPALGGRRVDLLTPRGLAPRLRDEILRTAVPLYGA
jgi:uncharacterized protein